MLNTIFVCQSILLTWLLTAARRRWYTACEDRQKSWWFLSEMNSDCTMLGANNSEKLRGWQETTVPGLGGRMAETAMSVSLRDQWAQDGGPPVTNQLARLDVLPVSPTAESLSISVRQPFRERGWKITAKITRIERSEALARLAALPKSKLISAT